MLKLVLASQSPRRKKLLTQLGFIFEIVPSNSEEIITSDIPSNIVKDLSMQKAEEVAKSMPDSLVIGADTIVIHEGEILGKPKNQKDAFDTLTKLSGSTHEVFTGISLVITNTMNEIIKSHSFYEETKVSFSPLTPIEIESYIETQSPMDKAGAYGIQDDWGSVFVERIEGDFYNVVGFPINRFYRELKDFHPKTAHSFSTHYSE